MEILRELIIDMECILSNLLFVKFKYCVLVPVLEILPQSMTRFFSPVNTLKKKKTDIKQKHNQKTTTTTT